MEQKFWNSYFKVYDSLMKLHPYIEAINLIIQEVSPQPGENILDAGCGSGNISIKLTEKNSMVTCFDFSPYALAVAKKKNAHLKIVQGDLSIDFPFQEGSFQKIVSNNVLYSISSEMRPAVIDNFFHSLTDGGKLIIANPKPGFNDFSILSEHFYYIKQERGIYHAILNFIGIFPNLISLFIYNRILDIKLLGQKRRLISKEEQEGILRGAGFTIIMTKKIYGGQGNLTVAKK